MRRGIGQPINELVRTASIRQALYAPDLLAPVARFAIVLSALNLLRWRSLFFIPNLRRIVLFSMKSFLRSCY